VDWPPGLTVLKALGIVRLPGSHPLKRGLAAENADIRMWFYRKRIHRLLTCTGYPGQIAVARRVSNRRELSIP
jgi:hypothetical protein